MDAWAARGRRWVIAGEVEEEGAGEVVARAVGARAAGAERGCMVVVEAVPMLICFGGGMLRHAPAAALSGWIANIASGASFLTLF